ncbi:MAG: hypothetical protein Q9162_000886 [Coniocarpon cinnabarinum]
MVLSRLIWFITPHSRLDWHLTGLPPRFIGIIFVALDFFALVIEILGSATYLGKNDDDSDKQTTSNTLAFGLVVQAAIIILFLAVCTIFAVKGKRWNALTIWKVEPNVRSQWQRLLYAIIAANALILLRTIFNMIETFALAKTSQDDVSAYLLNHEWTYCVFDAIPMLASVILLLVFHPGQYIPRRFTGFRLRAKALRLEKHRVEYDDTAAATQHRPATLFKDTEKTAAMAYHLPRKVPKAYYREEREHPAFA